MPLHEKLRNDWMHIRSLNLIQEIWAKTSNKYEDALFFPTFLSLQIVLDL